MSLRVKGAVALFKSLDDIIKTVGDTANANNRKALDKVGLVVAAEAKRKVKVGRSGALRASIVSQVRKFQSVLMALIGSHLPYAPTVEKGSRIHAIKVKKKRILAVNVMTKAGSIRKGFNDTIFKWADTQGLSFADAIDEIISNGGYIFFGRVVGHPGTKKQPFLAPAVKKTKPVVMKIFAEQGWKAITSEIIVETGKTA